MKSILNSNDVLNEFPIGSIIIWGQEYNIPYGWAICDGYSYTTLYGTKSTVNMKQNGNYPLFPRGRESGDSSVSNNYGFNYQPSHYHSFRVYFEENTAASISRASGTGRTWASPTHTHGNIDSGGFSNTTSNSSLNSSTVYTIDPPHKTMIYIERIY